MCTIRMIARLWQNFITRYLWQRFLKIEALKKTLQSKVYYFMSLILSEFFIFGRKHFLRYNMREQSKVSGSLFTVLPILYWFYCIAFVLNDDIGDINKNRLCFQRNQNSDFRSDLWAEFRAKFRAEFLGQVVMKRWISC